MALTYCQGYETHAALPHTNRCLMLKGLGKDITDGVILHPQTLRSEYFHPRLRVKGVSWIGDGTHTNFTHGSISFWLISRKQGVALTNRNKEWEVETQKP